MPPQRSAALDPTVPLNARAQAQRERILDAAQRCFIARGFHAASVSDIATEAGISQGLMYRYFDNKRAMILALIERQLRSDQEGMRATPLSANIVEELLEIHRLWTRGESIAGGDASIASVALYVEITAEAQRDPVVAQVLQRHDRLTTQTVCDWLRQHDLSRGAPIDEADLQRRTLLMRTVVEGLAMRAARDPDIAPDTVRAMLASTMAQVLGG
ncbi:MULTISPECIES: TetR/AcrR family transcriptional regulator [Pseudoxanthomonas]|uniref:AcrR family transcriptional regulator n=1 Tax=Pseudoxanthomonas winnipegensis TaxID=2480810 RepID=A0AAW8GAH9_9GAMM|nr:MULTISPECIES: TetR/AcrR family transcriptional regulator [Pseudoxanthomonas]MDQ1118203.1 AcrR family transcriptional regulator [Pseudoxanthomonas winnipegensis]MDQ1135176.1 AcrR family transcriptional regulator [Pseudoxanthomonas winnipegensis]MDR6138596.1 AcrR family transcriptional regulator [Pseudoxanthomonas sp. SORGH_AS_0997]